MARLLEADVIANPLLEGDREDQSNGWLQDTNGVERGIRCAYEDEDEEYGEFEPDEGDDDFDDDLDEDYDDDEDFDDDDEDDDLDDGLDDDDDL